MRYYIDMNTHITSAEAAEIIGVEDRQVRKLVAAKKIRGERRGRDWWIERASAEEYAATERKPGRKSASRE